MHKLYDFMEARERLSTITGENKIASIVMCSLTSVAMMYISGQKICK